MRPIYKQWKENRMYTQILSDFCIPWPRHTFRVVWLAFNSLLLLKLLTTFYRKTILERNMSQLTNNCSLNRLNYDYIFLTIHWNSLLLNEPHVHEKDKQDTTSYWALTLIFFTWLKKKISHTVSISTQRLENLKILAAMASWKNIC